MTEKTYPVTVTGNLSSPPSRALWLIKWLLLLPHYIILAFLYVAYFFVALIALFAILFTGRFPRPLFDFNVGVMRWSWRVSFYGYHVLGTDDYPPFSMQRGNYPADLQVEYPESLSHGLVLVKWWLLAIPHYLVVGVLTGGFGASRGGLGTLLALYAAIVRLFGKEYPEDIFKIVVGFNRWSIRVAAYAGLMTDEYPPFRFWD
ncbi:MAG: DUF4389 domain-containing protein [Candidatus Aminicenantes bacterium]